jgi:hypothetical protein
VTLGHNSPVPAIRFFGEPDKLSHRTQIRFSGVLCIIYWFLLLFFSLGTATILLLLLFIYFSYCYYYFSPGWFLLLFFTLGTTTLLLLLLLFFSQDLGFRTSMRAPGLVGVKPELRQGRNYDLPTKC